MRRALGGTLRSLLPLLTLLMYSTVALAQVAPAPEPLPAFRNRVLGVFNAETGAPVEIALVSDVVSGAAAYTSNTGTLALTFLPEGASVIRVQKIGYQPIVQAVEISPRDTLPITLLITPLPTLATVTTTGIAPVYVSAKMRGFEERRREGFGRFLTEAQLRKNDNRNLTSLVRGMGSINFNCPTRGPDSGKCFPISTRGKCEVPVYIDGIRSPDNDLERLQALNFSGIEYYVGASTVPAQYNMTSNACGAILLWTRDR
jgi:hypothetical protein